MGQMIKLTETQMKKVIDGLIRENSEIDEMDYQSFHGDEHLQDLRDSINKNKTVSVAYVKKDGTVRHMAARKFLKAYVPSTAEKTEKQLNQDENNDQKTVIDMNVYIKKKRETGDAALAAKMSWRKINLKDVLGFMAGGQFYDLREENQIMERFGEEVHGQLTKSMIKSLEQDNQEVEVEVPQDNEQEQPVEPMNEGKRKVRLTESELVNLIKRMVS
jgi:hypothetical protein